MSPTGSGPGRPPDPDALADAEARYHLLAGQTLDAVSVYDTDGRFLFANDATARLLGVERPESLFGRSVLDFIAESDRDAARARLERVRREGRVETTLQTVNRADGKSVTIAVQSCRVRYAGQLAVQSVSHDVEDPLGMEEQLLRSASLYRALARHFPNGSIVIFDLSLRYVLADGPALRELGWTPSDLEGHRLGDRVGDPLREFLRPHYEAALRGESHAFDLSYRERPYLAQTVPLRQKDGRIFAGMMVLQDLSRLQSTEAALRESEARLRAVFEAGGVGISVTTAEGEILETNATLETMMGYGKDALHGRHMSEFTVADDQDDDLERFLQMVNDDVSSDHVEKRCMRSDGRVIWLAISRSLVPRGDEPPIVVSVIEDVTERKTLEAQFRQAQKMEAVGRLAGGIAHDFNNLLTAIGGHTMLALEMIDVGDPACEELEEVRKAAERAGALTRQLLAFSRRQILRPRVLDLNVELREIETMMRPLIGEDIDFRVEPAADQAYVHVDASQIEQIVMNLIVNARDAMASGGSLTVDTLRIEPGSAPADSPFDVPAVRLTVADTGSGIAPDVLPHIFEPFFTTKSEGRGTGLGLSTVYGIVQQSGGRISVDSQPGVGTRFYVDFPLVEPAAGAIDAGGAEEAAAASTAPTILVAEDEPGVRSLVRRVLQAEGYTVIEAQSAEDAMARLAELDVQPDLVLSDVVMPGLTGPQLIDRLRLRQPALPAVLMSGYAEHRQLDSDRLVTTPFLSKPFTPSALVRIVRGALRGQRRSADGPTN